MDTILRRLRSVTHGYHAASHERSLGLFGAWRALDDDPVLLCDCGRDHSADRTT